MGACKTKIPQLDFCHSPVRAMPDDPLDIPASQPSFQARKCARWLFLQCETGMRDQGMCKVALWVSLHLWPDQLIRAVSQIGDEGLSMAGVIRAIVDGHPAYGFPGLRVMPYGLKIIRWKATLP